MQFLDGYCCWNSVFLYLSINHDIYKIIISKFLRQMKEYIGAVSSVKGRSRRWEGKALHLDNAGDNIFSAPGVSHPVWIENQIHIDLHNFEY